MRSRISSSDSDEDAVVVVAVVAVVVVEDDDDGWIIEPLRNKRMHLNSSTEGYTRSSISLN